MNQHGTLAWHKSSFSSADGNANCVEVADRVDGGQIVRDSKNPAGPVLSFGSGAWAAFVHATQSGEFD